MKIITYPIVFLTKVSFDIIESVIWLPFELFTTNKRQHNVVKLRGISPEKSSIKIYKPKGFFGAPDRFFLKRKLRNPEWIFYSPDSVNNAFDANITISKDMKVFQVPEKSLGSGVLRKEISKDKFNTKGFVNWYPAIDIINGAGTNINGEEGTNIINDVSSYITAAKTIEEQKTRISTLEEKIEFGIKAIQDNALLIKQSEENILDSDSLSKQEKIDEQEQEFSKVADPYQPVNDMDDISVIALLELLGVEYDQYNSLNLIRKIELVRYTKFRYSKNIKKILTTNFTETATMKELQEVAEKISFKYKKNSNKKDLVSSMIEYAQFVKEIKFN